jgi:NitT/TauT family transport system substrate-binding protein
MSRPSTVSLCLALAVLCAGSTALAQAEKRNLRMTLAWTWSASQVMFPYGVDKGYFKAEGLEPALDRGAGSGAAVQRVASGTHDVGFADLGALIKFNLENPGRALVSTYIVEDETAMALFALQGKGIAKPKDIEGKRIGVSQFDGARQLFPVFAKVNNVDASRMTWKTVDAMLREVLLTRGEVDVITGFTTTTVPLLNSLQQKFVVLRYADYGMSGLGQALVASPEFVEKNPGTMRALVRALNRSVKAMIEQPAQSLASLTARDATLDLAAEGARLELMIKELILTPNVVKNGLSSADAKRVAASIDNVAQVTEAKQPLPVERVYTERFLPARAERVAPGYAK